MAKINQYPAKTVPSNNDVFVLHDPASGSTKSMTRGDLIGGAPLPASSVTSQAIAPNSVGPAQRTGGYYAAAITITNGTGIKTLTGFGFKPKEVQFIANYTSTAIFRTSIGGAVDLGGGNFFQYVQAGVARATGNSTDSMTLRCMRIVDSSNALVYAAQFVSFDADGVTLNVNNDDVNFRTWFVIARG